MQTANSTFEKIEGIVSVVIPIGMRTWFVIVKNYAVDAQLGRPFMDRFIRDILSTDVKISPWNPRPVTIVETKTVIISVYAYGTVFNVTMNSHNDDISH